MARLSSCSRASAALQSHQERTRDLHKAKMSLLKAVIDTSRGSRASQDQRALLEESMVEVESFDAGTALDLDKLDGTWLLQYTSASDVLSILQAGEFPFFKAGQIYQKFECKGRFDGGQVVNVVRWSIPGLLQDGEGATLFVTAGFSVVSARTIQLEFKEARLGEVLISEELQALLAPAVLPRTFLNLQILQAINSLDVRVPLRGRRPSNERRSLGLLYYLTYLDNDMLLGRAIGSGGVFVFGKTQSF
ncbi:hypothetical protein SELMODRAFT_422148 [Selaginella moellendorffii]|uniref:Plastid lipid-associated protein/fibrillin conserved domain-containing protein n=2 Tax=Selaginella moellendorffii TaxID=88036 RepID=D8SHH7_SELML|nr:hypothetical protein SELMODRAFT_422148 [Selaginella moellendorffii]